MESISKDIDHLDKMVLLEIHNIALELADRYLSYANLMHFRRLLPSMWIKDYLLMLYI